MRSRGTVRSARVSQSLGGSEPQKSSSKSVRKNEKTKCQWWPPFSPTRLARALRRQGWGEVGLKTQAYRRRARRSDFMPCFPKMFLSNRSIMSLWCSANQSASSATAAGPAPEAPLHSKGACAARAGTTTYRRPAPAPRCSPAKRHHGSFHRVCCNVYAVRRRLKCA